MKNIPSNKLGKAVYDVRSVDAQKGAYLKQKKYVSKENVLVVQDFTQLVVFNTFNVDLIFVDDHWFLAEAWKSFVEAGAIASAKKINIWIDGGGQHFKSTATLTFFLPTTKGGRKTNSNQFLSFLSRTFWLRHRGVTCQSEIMLNV